MAAKGSIAKDNVLKTIIKAFGEDYIGEESKKYYVWADDGGEKVQIAITLTCPKVTITASENPANDSAFELTAEKPQEPVEIKQEELDTLVKLMERLHI